MDDREQKSCESAEDINRFVQWRHAQAGQWKFCPLCGHDLGDHEWDGKVRRFCPSCGFVYWERPLPATAAIVVDRTSHRVVLVTRRYPPAVGGQTFPGGGVEVGESIAEAMHREVQEETGLQVAIDAQLGTWSTPTKETIITFFLAHPTGGRLQGGSDALKAEWVAIKDVPQLAFSVHQAAFDLFSAQFRIGGW